MIWPSKRLTILASTQSRELISLSGLRATQPVARSYVALLDRGQLVRVTDVDADPLVAKISRSVLGQDTRATAVLPLRVDGELKAFVRMDAAVPRQWSAAELNRMHDVGAPILLAADAELHAKAADHLQQENRRLNARIAEHRRTQIDLVHDARVLLDALTAEARDAAGELTGSQRERADLAISMGFDRLAAMLDGLDAGSSTPDPVPVDFGRLLYTLAPTLRSLAGQRVEVHLEVSDRLPELIARRSLLERMLLNLVGIAVEALQGAGKLVVRAARDGLDITVDVAVVPKRPSSDRLARVGVGQPHGDPRPRPPVGLAIARREASLLGATLNVRSGLGSTEFGLRFAADARSAT